MPPSRKKSPATEGKRKTRASDKSRTSIKKPTKKKITSVENDGSYLQHQASHSVPVSTLPPSDHSTISASTGQAILTMLSQIDASNKELSKRMDQLERNGSRSSTPLTSPTANHRSSTVAVSQSMVPPPPPQWVTAGGAATGCSALPGTSRQQPDQNAINRDAVVPGVDVLRSIPSISSAVTQLLASYDHQALQDVLPGKGHVPRRKSGRYNTTDNTLAGPHLRWPNEGLVSASNARRPPYDELNLSQWVAGQLSNALLIEDNVLLRQVLTQVVMTMKDSVSLPWQAVRAAWAVSMTDVEEGRLGWADTTQWSLNRISNSQLAVLNGQNLSTNNQKIRICRFYNEGSCTSEGHHGPYKHFCASCYKQGRSLMHPETRCFSRSSSRTQEQKTPASK